MIKIAKSLERLFHGLMQENDPDLTLPRLNAYRAHFNLPSIVPEQFEVAKPDEEQEISQEATEGSEFYNYNFEETVSESLEEVESSLIVQEEFAIEEEIYVERLEESEEVIEYLPEDYQPLRPDSPTPKILKTPHSKTDDEKLFTFRCHICSSRAFQNMKALALHCKEFHDCLPQVKCCSDECDSVLSTWRRLMMHKDKHFPNEGQLRCLQCQKVYVTTTGLVKHMEKHSVRLICSRCGKNFKDPKSLRWHEETHLKSLEERRNHQCPYPDCGLKFITKQACENHIGMKHQKIVSCYCNYPNCDKSFYTKKAFYEHLRNTHSERRFSCEHCSFKAKTKSALKIHKDIHTVDEVYHCDICDAAFSAYRRLKAHMSKFKTRGTIVRCSNISFFQFAILTQRHSDAKPAMPHLSEARI